MSAVCERAFWLDCHGASMLAVLSTPELPSVAEGLGVVIVVGGPQYRAGSHRQFTLLARRLAGAGFPTLRFDYRGMGDSEGDRRDFTQIGEDVSVAVSALREQSSVRRVVLWGLCDAASALLLAESARVTASGLVLVNPWVRSAASLGATRLKHYYAARFWSSEFWRRLFSGRVDLADAVASLSSSLIAVLRRPRTGAEKSYQARMARGLRSFKGSVLLALSGNDLTAQEFVEHAATDPFWEGLLDAGHIKMVCLGEADHTFSSARWRAWLEEETLSLLRKVSLEA